MSGDKRTLYGFNKVTSASKVKLPTMVEANNDEMTHHFQFKEDTNQLQSRAKITGKTSMALQTSITIDGAKYHFLTSIQYDGVDFSSQILYDWRDVYKFDKKEEDANIDMWEFCNDSSQNEGSNDVQVSMATSFNDENDWAE